VFPHLGFGVVGPAQGVLLDPSGYIDKVLPGV
jgi:hypothetical protein